ncbi:filamentous hemagglutinin, partial [Fulvimonas soli]
LTSGGELRNQGTLQADGGDATLAAGTLDNDGTVSAQANLRVQAAGAARNGGVLVGGQAVALSATGLSNDAGGQVQSGTDLSLSAATLANAGRLYAKGNATVEGHGLSNAAGALLLADGALTIDSDGDLANNGVLQAGTDLMLGRASSLSNAAGATVYAGRDLDLAVAHALANGGMLYAAHAASVAAGSVDNPGTLRSGGSLSLDSAGRLDSAGAIQAQQDLVLASAGPFSNAGKLYAIDGTLRIDAAGAFASAASGDVYAGQDVTLAAGSIDNAGVLEAGGNAGLMAQGAAGNSGTVQADRGDLALGGATVANQGVLSAFGQLQLTGANGLSNAGQAVAGRSLRLAGGSLANSGQMQSGADAVLRLAGIDNGGRIQAGGALAISGNQRLTNAAGGQLLAAGDLEADSAQSLDNAGVLQAGGNLVLSGAGTLQNRAGGTLYGTGRADLRFGGALENAGTLYAGQAFNLAAGALDNAGLLRSGGALQAHVQGDATNAGTAYALGTATWNLGGALLDDGVLAAAGDVALTAGRLDGAGTLAAGLRGDGTLGTTGTLAVTTTGTLAAHGRNLAGGDLVLRGSAVDLSGSQTRAGGDASLAAAQGDVDNRGGDLAANGTLTVQAQGALRNGGDSAAQGGKLSAQALALRAASLDNRYGTLMQSGNGNLALAFGGAFDNAHGTLAANAHDITIDAAALDNSGGAIRHAGTGTLSLAADGDLTNAGGQIAGNGSLAVRAGGTLDNAGGTLGVAGTADVRALTMDNGGGTLAAGAATLTLTQALTNLGGTLQAGGSLTVNAGALDNTGGYLKATGSQALGVNVSGALTNAGSGGAGGFIGGNGAVSLGAGSLRNAGRVYAGTTLAANSQGALDNSGGALQAMGSLAASAAATLGNRGGRIEAGAGNGAATLDVHGAGIDNTGGRIANAGAGASTIGAGGAIANQGGTLGGQGDVSLAASALDNRQSGHVAAGHDLALDLGGLDNRGGVLYAAGDLGWSHAGAQLANAGGSLGAGGSLSLALGAVDNAGGELAADGDVTLDLGAFTGTGRAAAGRDLTLELAGGYTNGVGNTLKANRDLALVLGGDFVNPAGAVLQAVRHLSVHAAGIANAAGADIASAATDLQASGDLTNAGRIEGDEVTLRAANLANTGTLIGGHIAATANTLTNGADLGDATGNAAYQSALIAATDGIDLYVGGTLLNRDATIFTLGDLTLAADASGRRSQAVINRSGDIEADGDVFLAATQFTNERRVFETTVHTLSADEQARNSRTGNPVARYRYDDGDPDHQPPSVDPSQVVGANELAQADAYCGANNVSNTQRCVGYGGGSGTAQSFRAVETDTALRQTLLSRTSAEGRLLAGNDITLSGSVRNDKSTLAAGHDLTINGQAQSGEVGSGTIGGETVQNIAWTPTVQVGRSMAEQVEFEHLQHDPRRWEGGDFQTYGTSQSSVELGLAQATQMFGALQASASADARITAGDTVAITAHTIDNTVVGADGRPVHNAIGLGANGGAQAVTGKGAGTVAGVAPTSGGAAGVALGTAPGAVAGGSLGLAQGRNGAGAGQGPAAGSVAATGVAAAGTIDAAGGPAAGTPATVSTANGAPPAATGVAAGGHAGTGAPLPPQTVANLAGPQPTVSLPQSGLYTIHSDPGSPYLVETDPRFTSYTQFISSDYLLDQLGLDPSSLHKRLGDGFYEERSVLDQITSLTGRRFLSDATDALAQYRALMDAGVQVAQQFDLSVGVALTPEQMASLTQDMVWLVNVTVDGQTVLTPVVYLSAEHARELASGGATIAGKHVLLTADGDLTNNGTIAASQDAQLKAANLLNGGDIRAGGDLSIAAAQDILNGGTVSAGGSVSLVAGNDVRSGVNVAQALGSVNLTDPGAPVSTVALTSLQPGSLVAGQSLAVSAGRDLSLDQAPVQAGGELRLAAGRDLTATATAITAGGDAQLLAGRDLTLAATAHTVRSGGVIDGVEATTHTVSTLTAGGTAALSAGRDLSSLGAQVSGATVGVSAGRDLLATAVTDTARTAGLAVQGHKVTTTHTEDQTVRGSTFEGGQGVNLLAGRDATLTAAAVRSEQGAVTLAAGHDVTLDAAAESHAWTQDAKTSSHGLLSSQTTRTHDATSDTYAIGSTLSGATVTVAAGNDLTARAAQLTAQGALGLTAGHDVTLAAGEQSHGEEHSERVERSSFFSTSRKRFGSVDPESYRRESATASTQTWSVGTTVSGDTVTIGAGHDLHGTAAQIAGTHDVTLAAGHDLVLDAGQDTYTESDGTKVSRTGLMNGGGFSVLIGNRTTQADTTVRDVGYTGSLVGSTDGQVTLSAGHDVHLTGSDVLSRTGTTVVGQNVTIDAALGSTDVTQQQRVHTGGITVGVGGALAGAATAVYGDARRGGQVSDSRLKALYATKAAYDAKDLASLDPGAYQAASQDNANGINLQVGIGGSTASSETRTHDETSDGSEIRSQGDVTIAATGGDLNIVGSTVGGNNVALAAA